MVMFPHQPCQLASRFFHWAMEAWRSNVWSKGVLPGAPPFARRVIGDHEYLFERGLVNQIILRPKNEFTFYGAMQRSVNMKKTCWAYRMCFVFGKVCSCMSHKCFRQYLAMCGMPPEPFWPKKSSGQLGPNHELRFGSRNGELEER